MKYKVIVQETVCVTYDEVEVEAADEEAAEKIAEEMRVQDQLGEPTEAVEAIDYDVFEAE
jgi:hypothetical protein